MSVLAAASLLRQGYEGFRPPHTNHEALIWAGDEGIGGEDGAANLDELTDVHGFGFFPGKFHDGGAVVLVGSFFGIGGMDMYRDWETKQNDMKQNKMT